MELEVESRNVEMTPRWKNEIETRMVDLQRGHDDLTHGRVTLTKNLHHKKLTNVAEALVVVSLPGRHTFTARKENKTFEEAIRKAFEAVAIELRKYREKRATKHSAPPPSPCFWGIVCKLFPKKSTASSSRKAVEKCISTNMRCRGSPSRTWKMEQRSSSIWSKARRLQATTVQPLPPVQL